MYETLPRLQGEGHSRNLRVARVGILHTCAGRMLRSNFQRPSPRVYL